MSRATTNLSVFKDAEPVAAGLLYDRLLGEPAGPVIAVHFGSEDVRKRLPMERLASLCDRLVNEVSGQILVLRAPGEEALLADLVAHMSTVPVIAPDMGLRSLACLMRNADMLICNDTGVLHLAAAVGLPTVSFHATSDPAIWKPPGPNHEALYTHGVSIASICLDAAFLAARRRLSSQPPL